MGNADEYVSHASDEYARKVMKSLKEGTWSRLEKSTDPADPKNVRDELESVIPC